MIEIRKSDSQVLEEGGADPARLYSSRHRLLSRSLLSWLYSPSERSPPPSVIMTHFLPICVCCCLGGQIHRPLWHIRTLIGNTPSRVHKTLFVTCERTEGGTVSDSESKSLWVLCFLLRPSCVGRGQPRGSVCGPRQAVFSPPGGRRTPRLCPYLPPRKLAS